MRPDARHETVFVRRKEKRRLEGDKLNTGHREGRYDPVVAADQSLTQAQQAALETGFEQIEERTGPGKHEEYHQSIHRLEGVYK